MMERNFTAEYDDVSSTEQLFDVTFRLTERTEELLFRGLSIEVSKGIENGTFEPQLLHLTKRLCEQTEKHPPWLDYDHDRVYDIECSVWDYYLLSDAIASQLSSKMGSLDSSHVAIQLFTTWVDITEQIREQHDDWSDNPIHYSVLDTLRYTQYMAEETDDVMPETEYVDSNGPLDIYEDENGNRWAKCRYCEQTFAGTDRDHVDECDEISDYVDLSDE